MNFALSAMVEFHARDFAAALAYAQRGLALEPNFWVTRYHIAQAYEQLGRHEEALNELAIGAGLSNNNSKALSVRGYIYAKTGRGNEAREVLKALHDASATRYVPPYARALVYAGLGEADAVFEWLSKAVDARDVHVIYLPVDPKWIHSATIPGSRRSCVVARLRAAEAHLDAEHRSSRIHEDARLAESDST